MKEATTPRIEQPARRSLHRRWVLIASVWTAVIFLAAYSLHLTGTSAGRWLLLAILVAAYQLHFLQRHLPLNRRPGEGYLLPRFGPGNWLTLLRGLGLALLAGFLFSPRPAGALAWAPAILYTGAGIADYLDGYLARRSNMATILGEKLDIAFDGLGVLLVSGLAVWYGQLPLWYLPLGLGRYLFLAGIWFRRRWGLPVYPLPPSAHRRIFAGFHMGFLTVVLWPIIPPAGAAIAGPVFGAATAASFLRDWGVTCGRLRPATSSYTRLQRWTYALIAGYLPLVLRLTILLTVSWRLLALPDRFPPPWMAILQAWRLPFALPAADILFLLAVAGASAAFLGLAPRLAAFALLFPLGFDIITFGVHRSTGLALVASLCLLILGGGLASLWQPVEPYLTQRGGK